jgi:hypothetical protein
MSAESDIVILLISCCCDLSTRLIRISWHARVIGERIAPSRQRRKSEIEYRNPKQPASFLSQHHRRKVDADRRKRGENFEVTDKD